MFHPPKRARRGYPENRIKSQKHTPDAGESAFQLRKPVMKTKWQEWRKGISKREFANEKTETLKTLAFWEGRSEDPPPTGWKRAWRLSKTHCFVKVCVSLRPQTPAACICVETHGFSERAFKNKNWKNENVNKHKVKCKSDQKYRFLQGKMNGAKVTTTTNAIWALIVL